MGSIQTGNAFISEAAQGRKITFTKVNSDYNLTYNDSFLAVDCSLTAINITLPSAVVANRNMAQTANPVYRIKKIDETSNRLNILTIENQTIDRLDSFFLEEPNEAINLISDGYNWLIF